MTPAAYSFSLAALLYGAFGAALVLGAIRRTSSPAQRTFAVAVVASAIWAAAGFLAIVTEEPLLIGATRVLDLVRYWGWFVFLMVIMGAAREGAPHRPLWIGAAVLLVLGAALLLILQPDDMPASLGRYLPFVALAYPTAGIVLVEQLFRNLPADSRWHLKPLCLGLACLFLFDIYLNSYALLFGRFNLDSLSVRPAVHALAVPLLLIAQKRQVAWAREIQLSRNAVFHGATLVLVGVYLLFISAIGYYVRDFGGDWGRALELALLSAALVFLALLVFSGAVRRKVRVFIGKNFFRYRYDYRTEWLRFTAMLTASGSPQEVGQLIVRGLSEMVHSPGGALWSIDSRGAEFASTAQWNLARCTDREPAASPLSCFLAEREWIVDLDEYREHPERYGDLQMPPWLLTNRQLWLVVPLLVGKQLTGFVTLSRPHASASVNWELRDLLKTASRQAASFLALMQTTEALLEVRKFDAFNRMSAFVVHDLKNIVAQLSLMMQNAGRLKDNPEFQQDMLMTVASSLEKMRRLMLQLREGETPAGVVSGVPLLPIVKRLQAAAAARGRRVELDVRDHVVTRGHDERVERVLGHMVQNGLDATEASGRIVVTLSRAGSQAKVVVSDNGEGMSAEFVNSQLFKPFNTTKANGMGIGAYESFQYVRELGGTISVESEVGRGTVVTMLLPLFESRQVSDLEMSSAK